MYMYLYNVMAHFYFFCSCIQDIRTYMCYGSLSNLIFFVVVYYSRHSKRHLVLGYSFRRLL